jgi:hypothetical protein
MRAVEVFQKTGIIAVPRAYFEHAAANKGDQVTAPIAFPMHCSGK